MSRIPNIIAELTSNAWCVEPGYLNSMAVALLNKHLGVSVDVNVVGEIRKETDERIAASEAAIMAAAYRVSGDAKDAPAAVERTAYGIRVGSVAVVSATGVLAKRAGMVNAPSKPEGTSLDALEAAMVAGLADTNVRSLLLRADSGGGYADGTAGMGDKIAAMRAAGRLAGGKPIVGFVDGMAGSAMYWLLCQCDRIEGNSDARVGSIGTYMVVPDLSANAAMEGVKVHLISTGGVKGVGEPGTVITPEALANWQRGVDAYQKHFEAAVARGRGMTPARVKELATGEMWMGADAVAKGLMDAVNTIAGTIAEMDRKFGGANGKAPSGQIKSNEHGQDARATDHGLEAHATGTPAAAVSDGSIVAVTEPDQTGGSTSMYGMSKVLMEAAGGINGTGGGGGSGGGVAGTIDPAKAGDLIAQGIAQEAARAGTIRARAKNFMHIAAVATLVTACLEDPKVSVDAFSDKLGDAIASGTKPTGIVGDATQIAVGQSGEARFARAAEFGMLVKTMPQSVDKILAGGAAGENLARAIGYDSVAQVQTLHNESRASGFQQMPLARLCEHSLDIVRARQGVRSCSAAGIHDPSTIARMALSMGGDRSDIYADGGASQSTGDLPYLFGNASERVMQLAFAEQETTWEKWCKIGSNNDFRPKDVIAESEAADLKLISGEGGHPEHMAMSDRRERVQLQTYGRKYGLTRKMVVNDDLDSAMQLPLKFGRAAARLPDKLAYAVLMANAAMADGTALFHADHANLLTAAALSMASLDIARVALQTQRGSGEDRAYLALRPKYLIVPPALAGTATALYTGEYDQTSGQANLARKNIVQSVAEPIVSPYVTITTPSVYPWFLLADPASMPLVEVSFLKGKRMPTIEQMPRLSSMDGPTNEIIFDVTAKAINWEPAQYNPGA